MLTYHVVGSKCKKEGGKPCTGPCVGRSVRILTSQGCSNFIFDSSSNIDEFFGFCEPGPRISHHPSEVGNRIVLSGTSASLDQGHLSLIRYGATNPTLCRRLMVNFDRLGCVP